ncbi:hypothetical protein CMT37_09065 [Elizabethkingia anophelis]|nr:hypothetical protein [Elizabethkingia anophelis]
MKSIYQFLHKKLKEFNQYWNNLSLQNQRRYILSIFSGYFLLTFWGIIQICTQAGTRKKELPIEHIKSPASYQNKPATALQDSISLIFKNDRHGK